MHRQLFEDAYAIIDGVPDPRIYLNSWQKLPAGRHLYVRGAEEITCNTIACAAGWLTLHPAMQALGLRAGVAGEPTFEDSEGIERWDYDALAHFFGLEYSQAEKLFCPRECSRTPLISKEVAAKLTDRELWLARARELLKEEDHECSTPT